MTEGPDWIEGCRRAARQGSVDGDREVLTGRLPPLLDGDGMRAVLVVAIAVAGWTYLIFGPDMRLHPLSPILLVAHLVLLAFTLRALFALRTLADRLILAIHARRHRLVLAPEGLFLDRPAGEVAVPREEILFIRERGDWRNRTGGRRYGEVFVVLVPDTKPRWLALPPVFERTPGVLAERLMRWHGPVPQEREHEHPPPARLASRIYDDAARGTPPPGGVVVHHGPGWLRRGPYATLLLAAVLLERAVRLPGYAWAYVDRGYLLGIGACLLAVPLVWAYLQRRHVAPRKGLALVMTPADVMIRIRSGILRAAWPNVTRVYVETKSTWSILEGHHAARQLVIERAEAPPIRYDEAFLGVPAEVALGLCESYRAGLLPR